MQDDEQRQLDAVQDDLLREFADRLSRDLVRARFEAVVRDFDGAPIRTYVPVLTQRRARAELSAAV